MVSRKAKVANQRAVFFSDSGAKHRRECLNCGLPCKVTLHKDYKYDYDNCPKKDMVKKCAP